MGCWRMALNVSMRRTSDISSKSTTNISCSLFATRCCTRYKRVVRRQHSENSPVAAYTLDSSFVARLTCRRWTVLPRTGARVWRPRCMDSGHDVAWRYIHQVLGEADAVMGPGPWAHDGMRGCGAYADHARLADAVRAVLCASTALQGG